MMRGYISGCKAAAEAARLAKVDVVSAYPITPQTHVVEALSKDIYDGRLEAELVPVESEHSALSVTVGAAMVGVRAFTATSSQGLALMHEVLPYAAGLRLPIVMVVANRSVASPVTIFTDHQDSLPQRETGFLQFYLQDCQEILDITLMAFKVAEDSRVLLPVMVCFDGFFLSHISETVEIPDIEVVSGFLPKVKTQTPILDVDDPKSFNVMAFPEFFEEFQRDKHECMLRAEEVFDETAEEFEKLFGRSHQRLETYRTDDAEWVIVGLGSMMGTVKVAVDELRSEGMPVGAARIKCYRPLPIQEIKQVLADCKCIGVLDRDVAYGTGGVVYQDICRCLLNSGSEAAVVNFILGLGGRDVTVATIRKCFDRMQSYGPGKGPEPGRDVMWPDENTLLWETWKVGE
jgi:pyruvate ferredoxin oxidoreductase alpha subunit